ncbi:MAG: hypothetical protein GXO59_01095 [Dictyoglomi bacterium]|nr:hypothetical protein [Dictyoglomota bacterium]
MGSVRKLSPDIIKQIAAGEVIERPASAVKELIENAIDAGATDIQVYIKSGGKEYIKVVDDGSGILRDDVPLIFEKHTTSKIYEPEDLHSIITLGFRGEALHAIAYAARRVVLTTKHADEDVGSRAVVEDGKLKDISMVSRTDGTTIEVFDLFQRLPARRKFLKSIGYETRKIVDVLFRYVFAYPEKTFSLYVDGKPKIKILGKEPKDFYYAYTKRKPEDVNILSAENDANISGNMWLFFDSMNYQPFTFISINGRPVVSGSIYALVKAIIRDRFGAEIPPSVVLWLWLPPHVIDPNIHPAKLEVDIKDKTLVKHLLLSMLREERTVSVSFNDISYQTKDGVKNPTGNISNDNTAIDGKKTSPSRISSVIKMFSPSEEQKQVEKGDYQEIPQIIDVIDNTFVVYRYKGQIKIADQHALMEGILFSILWEHKDKYIQSLTIPWHYEVRNPEEVVEKLSMLGFESTVLSENTVAVRAVPSVLSLRIWNRELMGQLIADIDTSTLSKDKIADVACKLSIKAGDKPSQQFLQTLVKIGEEYPEYRYDPHGRPAVIVLDTPLLEKLFKRK